MKTCITFLAIFSLLTMVSGQFLYDNPTLPKLNPPSNLSQLNVNNTVYWQGYLPTTLPHSLLANLLWSVAGHIIDTNMDFNRHNIFNISNLSITNNVTINGSLVVNGNVSLKRPYWTGYDNSTQPFVSTAVAQIMNLSNNNDFDSYGIYITNRQNISFAQTGDYLIWISPEFFQSSGQPGIITFYLQKTNSSGQFVDVPWSNSRYTVPNGAYNAPAIPYQVDITNPAQDKVRVMWWSDSTNSQIYSSGVLTNPARPSIPGVLVNIQKVSELTP